METEKKYWVGFNLVKGVGPARLRKLLDYFGTAQEAWLASFEALRSAGLSEKIVERIFQIRSQIDLDAVLERALSNQICVLTWDDPGYPKRLIEIEAPPPVLYVRGEVGDLDQWAIAIVGTRRVTAYGRQVADRVATLLAQRGVTVVSGLARGVDAVAHRSTLRAGGRTFAVLGCGVDRIYPPEHRRLAEEIVANGALISDYPLGTPPEGLNFPPRNRIISGLSMAVVIVEGSRNSGALITAEFAADQGREVFAVPGNITAPQSRGPNWLIQQGAIPLLDPEEVLEHLELSRLPQQREARKILPANETETQLLAAINLEPKHVDEISNEVNLPVASVSGTLALMELKGLVRQVGGMRYVAIHEDQAGYHVDSE